jgi:hypothetical protein
MLIDTSKRFLQLQGSVRQNEDIMHLPHPSLLDHNDLI